MKKTWEGINNLISNKQRKAKPVSTLQLPNNQGVTQNQSEIANVCELEKAPFKCKLKHMVLQILQTGEMNVDMRYLNLSKYAV